MILLFVHCTWQTDGICKWCCILVVLNSCHKLFLRKIFKTHLVLTPLLSNKTFLMLKCKTEHFSFWQLVIWAKVKVTICDMKWVVDIKSSTISQEKKGNFQQAAKTLKKKNSILIISSWARVIMAMITNFFNGLQTAWELMMILTMLMMMIDDTEIIFF